MTGAGLTFLGWVRPGPLARAAPAPADAGGSPLDEDPPAVAALPVRLTMTGVGDAGIAATLLGPGDVVGLEHGQVIGHLPEPGRTVAPNFLAAVEFDRPDLPWLFSPGATAEPVAGASDRRRGLRPWLALVVVPDAPLAAAGAEGLPDRLTVSIDELPEPATAWLWAHAQILTTGAPGETVETLIEEQPARTLSRLLCPRRLRPATAYRACVVPLFDAGRRSGLGLPPVEGATTLAPAWNPADAPDVVTLPVYHSWTFSTGPVGDHEELARRIRGHRAARAGVRALDIGAAGPGMPTAPPGAAWVIDYEGAAIGADVTPGAWPDGPSAPDRATYGAELAARLDPGDARLPPPTYGALQAGFAGSLAAGEGPPWLRELVLDPRYRVAAALGTRLVQQHQEALMDAAWEQTADLRRADRVLRRAQLARALGESTHARRIGPADRPVMSDARLLALTAAVHGAVPIEDAPPDGRVDDGERAATVAEAIAADVAVRAAVGVGFRRVVRPRGPLARRLVADDPLPSPLPGLAKVPGADGKLRPAPALQAVGGTVDLDRLSGGRESFATLAPGRVVLPVFPWELAAPASGPAVGVWADLVVATLDMSGPRSHAPRYVIARGAALDANGVPELGWQVENTPTIAPIPLNGTNESWVQVESGWAVGTLEFGTTSWYAGGFGDFHTGRAVWIPRSGRPADGRPVPIGTQYPGGAPTAATAAGEGSVPGRVDAVFVLSGTVHGNAGALLPSTTVTIGRDLRADGSFAGFTPAVEVASWAGPVSAALAGDHAYVLAGKSLRVLSTSTGQVVGGYPLDPQLPPDVRAVALTGADFGGGVGLDLVVVYVAGYGRALRTGYRLAYDVGPSKVGEWGPDREVPIPVAGTAVGVMLSTLEPEIVERRIVATKAFRHTAKRTQGRQARIVATAAPPPPTPGTPVSELAGDLRAELNPTRTVPKATADRVDLGAPLAPEVVRDPLQPLRMTPRFGVPAYELLRELAQDRLMPGVAGMPDDRAALLVVNTRAVEAVLAGMNHEMSRELLWRGFPVHHGTFFASFWSAGRPDVTPVEGWEGGLGSHGARGPEAGTLLLVRAELLRRMREVTVYAAPATLDSTIDPRGRPVPDLAARVDPDLRAELRPDIVVYAFDTLSPADLSGDGWFLVLQEEPTTPRFGLDESGPAGTPATWDDLAWEHAVHDPGDGTPVFVGVGPEALLEGVELHDAPGAGALRHRWGVDAASMAHILLQRPVQVAIPARMLMRSPEPVGPA